MVNLIEPAATWLRGREYDKYSQFGEDGLVAAILERIGEKNRWCFEVGAADGEFFSNTLRLREAGWSALLIESDPDQFAKLERFQSSQVRCVHQTIGPDSLDALLCGIGAPTDLDFGVIDIDGQDYWIFEGLRMYRPRVLMVEHANAKAEAPPPPKGGTGLEQAGYEAIVQLGRDKGYRPLVSTQVNALFVANEAWQ